PYENKITGLTEKSITLKLKKNGEHAGSKGLHKFDEEFNPDVHICGHVHEAAGIYRYKNTTIINPGMQKPKYPVLTLQIPEMIIGNIQL
ncbi:MAG: metallophosphoesterase family protein, partial [Thermoplasmata archaeon]